MFSWILFMMYSILEKHIIACLEYICVPINIGIGIAQSSVAWIFIMEDIDQILPFLDRNRDIVKNLELTQVLGIIYRHILYILQVQYILCFLKVLLENLFKILPKNYFYLYNTCIQNLSYRYHTCFYANIMVLQSFFSIFFS